MRHAQVDRRDTGSLIGPRAVLESLAAGDAQPADVLLKWQRECLGMDA